MAFHVPPAVSIIVATRDRADLLSQALGTLAKAVAAATVACEVIVVDNGSTDGTPELIERLRVEQPDWRFLACPAPGKARALNLALTGAKAELLAFTDDDVVLPENWIERLVAFFAAHPEYAAGMGVVRADPAGLNPDTVRRLARYQTLPLYDRGSEVIDTKHLYGCNMGIRRAALDQVGAFDERLGPGASGLHEDGDMSRRIRQAGLRIGYMPDVLLHHVVESDRLTEDFFRAIHVRDGASRFAQDEPSGSLKPLSRLMGATATYSLWSLVGSERRRMRARARMISHREYLRRFLDTST